jgi:SAM-dependent methyltransferase
MMLKKLLHSDLPIIRNIRAIYHSFIKDKHLKLFHDPPKAMPQGSESYNEAKYLELNPDVADAVKKGQFATGWEHYLRSGRRDKRLISSPGSVPLPPVSLMNYVGSKDPNDFIRVGREFVAYLQELCGLKPEASILEVGCGCGRMAIPLTDHLSQNGRYCGFDVDKDCISWAQNKITRNRSNFSFIRADIYNDLYNPKGTILPEEFKFPFEEDSFDIVYLPSVFTHMLPGEMEHYLLEIARVMKKGGKCLITYFLINGESSSLIAKNESALGIRHKGENYWTSNPEVPGAAVGYDEAQAREGYGRFGLKIDNVYYGSWCGRKNYLSFQDIIVAEKPA